MEDVEAEKRKRKSGKGRSKAAPVVQEASSSTGNDNLDEDEKDFFETHCHWINCDRDFDTQDQLVKVDICFDCGAIHTCFVVVQLTFCDRGAIVT